MLCHSTAVSSGLPGAVQRTSGACATIEGRVISHMRFMKPVVAIAAICATMLTMRIMRSKRMAGRVRKRRGLRRAR